MVTVSKPRYAYRQKNLLSPVSHLPELNKRFTKVTCFLKFSSMDKVSVC